MSHNKFIKNISAFIRIYEWIYWNNIQKMFKRSGQKKSKMLIKTLYLAWFKTFSELNILSVFSQILDIFRVPCWVCLHCQCSSDGDEEQRNLSSFSDLGITCSRVRLEHLYMKSPQHFYWHPNFVSTFMCIRKEGIVSIIRVWCLI